MNDWRLTSALYRASRIENQASGEYRMIASWTRLSLVTTPEYTEACAALLLDTGCDGVQIDDTVVQLDESEDATLVPRAEPLITTYLDHTRPVAALREQLEALLAAREIPARVEVEPVADEDWATKWRENFPPLRIGAFLIVPSWEENTVTAEGEAISIRLDPGLAFGTGQHPTTRMCLELLGDHARAGQTLLDVGCGSGILSIAAAKLGLEVTGSDLDPFCVAATRDNARDNAAMVHVVQAAGTAWTQQHYDIVIANLMSALLISLAADLAAVTRPGGTLIVSGISEPRAAEVEAALQAAGFSTVESRLMDGEQRGDYVERWAAFVMIRRDA